MKPSELKPGTIIRSRYGTQPITRRIESIGKKMSMISPLDEREAYAVHNDMLCRHWEVIS